MNATHDTVLQFGAGNFLRAFVCRFAQEINQANPNNSPLGVYVVQSTDGARANLLQESGGVFHVVVRGLENGEAIERVQRVESVRGALVAGREWAKVLDVARSPRLVAITSNTTEAGLTLEGDEPIPASETDAPRSFPAKLLSCLRARFEAKLPPTLILPCELIADNADRLRGLVLAQAERWSWHEPDFADWLVNGCQWSNTLVDGIVSGRPDSPDGLGEQATALWHSDPLLTVAEPFRFFAVEDKPGTERFNHPDILRVPDVGPYALRKVRILNGAHTALVEHIRQTGRTDLQYVREAVRDSAIAPWLSRLLFEEIVPTVADRVDDAEGFARDTLERFANPYINHRLSDIALHHETKIQVRLQPTVQEYKAKFGYDAPLLSALLLGK